MGFHGSSVDFLLYNLCKYLDRHYMTLHSLTMITTCIKFVWSIDPLSLLVRIGISCEDV